MLQSFEVEGIDKSYAQSFYHFIKVGVFISVGEALKCDKIRSTRITFFLTLFAFHKISSANYGGD